MWTAILSFLGGPLVNGAIKAYQAKLASGNTSENIAAELAARELAVQQKEIEVQAQYKTALIGHWYEPANLAAYIFVGYLFNVVVWDTMLGLGTTPAIKGDVGVWLGMIAIFLFGKRGIENVALILRK
jgi:hypothetical protein